MRIQAQFLTQSRGPLSKSAAALIGFFAFGAGNIAIAPLFQAIRAPKIVRTESISGRDLVKRLIASSPMSESDPSRVGILPVWDFGDLRSKTAIGRAQHIAVHKRVGKRRASLSLQKPIVEHSTQNHEGAVIGQSVGESYIEILNTLRSRLRVEVQIAEALERDSRIQAQVVSVGPKNHSNISWDFEKVSETIVANKDLSRTTQRAVVAGSFKIVAQRRQNLQQNRIFNQKSNADRQIASTPKVVGEAAAPAVAQREDSSKTNVQAGMLNANPSMDGECSDAISAQRLQCNVSTWVHAKSSINRWDLIQGPSKYLSTLVGGSYIEPSESRLLVARDWLDYFGTGRADSNWTIVFGYVDSHVSIHGGDVRRSKLRDGKEFFVAAVPIVQGGYLAIHATDYPRGMTGHIVAPGLPGVATRVDFINPSIQRVKGRVLDAVSSEALPLQGVQVKVASPEGQTEVASFTNMEGEFDLGEVLVFGDHATYLDVSGDEVFTQRMQFDIKGSNTPGKDFYVFREEWLKSQWSRVEGLETLPNTGSVVGRVGVPVTTVDTVLSVVTRPIELNAFNKGIVPETYQYDPVFGDYTHTKRLLGPQSESKAQFFMSLNLPAGANRVDVRLTGRNYDLQESHWVPVSPNVIYLFNSDL